MKHAFILITDAILLTTFVFILFFCAVYYAAPRKKKNTREERNYDVIPESGMWVGADGRLHSEFETV